MLNPSCKWCRPRLLKELFLFRMKLWLKCTIILIFPRELKHYNFSWLRTHLCQAKTLLIPPLFPWQNQTYYHNSFLFTWLLFWPMAWWSYYNFPIYPINWIQALCPFQLQPVSSICNPWKTCQSFHRWIFSLLLCVGLHVFVFLGRQVPVFIKKNEWGRWSSINDSLDNIGNER